MDIKEMLKDPEKYIPKKTFYCYDKDNTCPFWESKDDLPVQENGYCHYLDKNDYELNEEYNKLPIKVWVRATDEVNVGTTEELFGNLHFPTSLLWDMCKECGISDDMEFDNYNKDDEIDFDNIPTKKCSCGREYPDIPMYFNVDGLCLVCNQD